MNKTIGLDAIIKEHFTGTDPNQKSMTRWLHDGSNVVATNAHVLIICPEQYIDEWPSRFVGGFPDYKAAMPVFDPEKSVCSFDIQQLRYFEKTIPTEPEYKECVHCEGEGWVTGHDSSILTCNPCKGLGITDQIARHVTESLHYVQIEDSIFNPDLLYKLTRIYEALKPDSNEVQCLSLNTRSGNVFRIKDITFLIMPILYRDVSDLSEYTIYRINTTKL